MNHFRGLAFPLSRIVFEVMMKQDQHSMFSSGLTVYSLLLQGLSFKGEQRNFLINVLNQRSTNSYMIS